MHSLQPQQNAQLRPRGHDGNIVEEAYRGRYARQRLLNFWPESSCGYHAIKRFVCIIQVPQSIQPVFCPVELPEWYKARIECWDEARMGFSYRSVRAVAVNRLGSSQIDQSCLLAAPQNFHQISLRGFAS